ncbi:hypothetical protein DPMN_126743 [Dreissena polymorpha]|uniref:3'-5' exonuclease domain-containing protein n=1 Tax=Dreissena polymorpha TaxID=45954 RepID=A0A9D4GXP1_DREPO|nr:hypothetical protein DPMN_126743 [Dreissena polymorpha]
MQISTRSHDYLVDTLELRGDLQCLNTVFTDPNIVKVSLSIRVRTDLDKCMNINVLLEKCL